MVYTKEESEKIVGFLASVLTDFIQSEVRVRSLTRTLVDSIDCYTRNNEVFLNGNRNVRWFNWGDLCKLKRRNGLLEEFPHISNDAYEVLSAAERGINIPKVPKRLICDHVMPVKAIDEHLRNSQYHDPADTLGFLNNHYRRCIITTDENKLLDKDLKSKMPSDWKSAASPFVRYEKVGIKLKR